MINPQWCNIMQEAGNEFSFPFEGEGRAASKIRVEERFSAIRLDLIIRAVLLSRKLIVEIFIMQSKTEVLNLSFLTGLNVTYGIVIPKIFFSRCNFE